jgi:hypothetical protein
MRARLLSFLLAISIPAGGQTAEAIYKRACGPKASLFDVQQVKGNPHVEPELGKALVYFIQKESGAYFTTRVGLDGAWVGVIQRDPYIFTSVAPGEHHACVATKDRKPPEAELVHFTAEPGKVYYYLIRGIAASTGYGGFATIEVSLADRDEALLLIASDSKSVATPKP